MSRDAAEVLRVIYELGQSRGVAPTLREIAAALGVGSHNAARYWIRKLEREGWLDRRPGLQRATRVTEAGMRRLGVL